RDRLRKGRFARPLSDVNVLFIQWPSGVGWLRLDLHGTTAGFYVTNSRLSYSPVGNPFRRTGARLARLAPTTKRWSMTARKNCAGLRHWALAPSDYNMIIRW